MNISENGLNFIKQFEGFRNEAYQDSVNIWTIGYGTTKYPNGSPVRKGERCTAEQALFWLKLDVKRAAKAISSFEFKLPLNQSQFDALTSFHYNTGAFDAIHCRLRDKAIVNASDESIYKYNPENLVDSCEFLRWVRGNGKIIKGLIARRKAEADLYSSEIKGSIEMPPVHF